MPAQPFRGSRVLDDGFEFAGKVAWRICFVGYAIEQVEPVQVKSSTPYGLFFTEQVQNFLEDGFRFVGVATWLVCFARYGYQKSLFRNQ